MVWKRIYNSSSKAGNGYSFYVEKSGKVRENEARKLYEPWALVGKSYYCRSSFLTFENLNKNEAILSTIYFGKFFSLEI